MLTVAVAVVVMVVVVELGLRVLAAQVVVKVALVGDVRLRKDLFCSHQGPTAVKDLGAVVSGLAHDAVYLHLFCLFQCYDFSK